VVAAGRWALLRAEEGSELARLAGSQVLVQPVMRGGRVVGAVLAGGSAAADHEISSIVTQLIDAAVTHLSTFLENVTLFAEQRGLFLGTLHALTASIDAKDPYTRGHSERVSVLGALMAAGLGWDSEQIEHTRVAGLLHDVGKIGIPEAVLCKPGRLNENEFAIIKRHPSIGYNILKGIPLLAPMLPGVLHHHERWDGSGYPSGLTGEEIPIVGRILCMADAYDAMRSNRSYRPRLTPERAMSEIASCAGTQFDPALSALFARLDLSAFDASLERSSNRAAA
jgi:HD-GYP domain-containing protein (c-di-GMP phosphodiesterase class II)